MSVAPRWKTLPPGLSAEARAVYEQTESWLEDADPEDDEAFARFRAEADAELAALAGASSVRCEQERVEIGGVPCTWVTTPETPANGKAIVYLHGGGYTTGSVEVLAPTVASVAEAAGIRVLGVEYRLAPEHPFPAGLEDALAVYRALLATGLAASNIALFGDSAGGGLSLATALSLREAGDPLPAAIALSSPWTDLTHSGDSHLTLVEWDPMLHWERSLVRSARAYAGDRDPADPLLSPCFADLTGLPPLWIQVGTREILLSDSVRLGQRARAAGVDVVLDIWDGLFHCHYAYAELPEAREACAALGSFLANHLGAEETKR